MCPNFSSTHQITISKRLLKLILIECFFRNSSSGSLPQHPHGFESDYPMGGTIKKRPSIIGTHPKLPLTNTTRGLVRDSEDDSSSIGKFEKTYLENSWRIPGEFLENSWRIPGEFLKNSSRIPQEFQCTTFTNKKSLYVFVSKQNVVGNLEYFLLKIQIAASEF